MSLSVRPVRPSLLLSFYSNICNNNNKCFLIKSNDLFCYQIQRHFCNSSNKKSSILTTHPFMKTKSIYIENKLYYSSSDDKTTDGQKSDKATDKSINTEKDNNFHSKEDIKGI